MTEENTEKTQRTLTDPRLQIYKIYTKDVSFQIPDGPQAFQTEWSPELNIDVHTETKSLLEKSTYEVILSVKCSVNTKNRLAFTIEVQQSGIFKILHIDNEELRLTLGIYCPNILYPYLREVISTTVTNGGFPQLSLAPINFDMLYKQRQKNVNNKI